MFRNLNENQLKTLFDYLVDDKTALSIKSRLKKGRAITLEIPGVFSITLTSEAKMKEVVKELENVLHLV